MSTPVKLSLGVTGFLVGSSGLFYYGAVKQRRQITKERPGNIVELGDTNHRISFHVEINKGHKGILEMDSERQQLDRS